MREVAGAAVSLGVATCVVDPVGVLAGGEGPAVVWVVGSVVVSVGRGLVFGVEAEAGSVPGAGGGERGTPVDEVRLWVATGVEVVEAGAESVLLAVAEDVTDGGVGTSVATGWLEVSLGAVPVVVGCGGGTPVLGAGGLAPSVGVALGLPEAGEEAPSEVAGMVLEWKGVAVLRGVVKMEGAAGVLAEVAWTGEVLCVWWVLGPEEMIPVVGVAAGVGMGVAEAVAGGVGVAEVLARASVGPRSTVAVEVAVDRPAGPVDVASVVAGVELGAPVLTEEGGRVVDVCSVAEAGRGEVNADVRVLPGESMVEEVRTGALDGAVGTGVVTRRVLAGLVV